MTAHGEEVFPKTDDATVIYQKLSRLEDELAGDPTYDMLLGKAAIQSGQPVKAVLALERVIITQPENSESRLLLASAYLALGEFYRLRDLLLTIDPSNLSPQSRSTWLILVQRQAVVEASNTPKQQPFDGYLRLTLGYDDNSNSGPPPDELESLGLFTSETIDQLQPQPSFFSALRGVANYRNQLSDKTVFLADATVEKRLYEAAHDNDTLHAKFEAGISHNWNKERITIHGGLSNTWFGQSIQQRSPSVTMQWRHMGEGGTQTTFIGQGVIYLYNDDSSRNSRRWTAGVNQQTSSSFPKKGTNLQYGAHIGAFIINNKTYAENRHYLGGLNLGIEVPIKKDLWIFARSSYEKKKYEQNTSSLVDQQVDDRIDFSSGVSYRINKDWRTTIRHDFVSNFSNNPIEEYQRNVFGLSLQRSF
ncbi:MAG: hypothetical protein HQL71_02410 [Magnetococcales bacterium]|nr:hypothetical protein [Magnetococcales bacterium]